MFADALWDLFSDALVVLCPEPQREGPGGQPATQCPRPKERPVWAATRETWIIV
jgi:hypothetical protein